MADFCEQGEEFCGSIKAMNDLTAVSSLIKLPKRHQMEARNAP
jgi:hypothetical protein